MPLQRVALLGRRTRSLRRQLRLCGDSSGLGTDGHPRPVARGLSGSSGSRDAAHWAAAAAVLQSLCSPCTPRAGHDSAAAGWGHV